MFALLLALSADAIPVGYIAPPHQGPLGRSNGQSIAVHQDHFYAWTTDGGLVGRWSPVPVLDAATGCGGVFFLGQDADHATLFFTDAKRVNQALKTGAPQSLVLGLTDDGVVSIDLDAKTLSRWSCDLEPTQTSFGWEGTAPRQAVPMRAYLDGADLMWGGRSYRLALAGGGLRHEPRHPRHEYHRCTTTWCEETGPWGLGLMQVFGHDGMDVHTQLSLRADGVVTFVVDDACVAKQRSDWLTPMKRPDFSQIKPWVGQHGSELLFAEMLEGELLILYRGQSTMWSTHRDGGRLNSDVPVLSLMPASREASCDVPKGLSPWAD